MSRLLSETGGKGEMSRREGSRAEGRSFRNFEPWTSSRACRARLACLAHASRARAADRRLQQKRSWI